MHIPRNVFEASDLKDALDAFLNEHSYKFNLEDYCRNGGSIGEVEISRVEVHPFKDDDLYIKGRFFIEFCESYYNGCKDIEWRVDFSGPGQFTIDREAEDIAFSVRAKSVPERESEEPANLEELVDEMNQKENEK